MCENRAGLPGALMRCEWDFLSDVVGIGCEMEMCVIPKATPREISKRDLFLEYYTTIPYHTIP